MEVKSVKGLVFKFGVSYIVTLLGINIILNMLNINNNTSAAVLIIFFLLKFWVTKYMNYNGVELSKSDFTKIFFGACAFIVIYDLAIITIMIKVTNLPISQSILLIGIAIGVILDALAVFFAIYIANKQFKKKFLLNKKQE